MLQARQTALSVLLPNKLNKKFNLDLVYLSLPVSGNLTHTALNYFRLNHEEKGFFQFNHLTADAAYIRVFIFY